LRILPPAEAGKPPLGEKGPRATRRRPSNWSNERFDAVKENGPIFVGWPDTKPQVALAITGRQEGYLEPCGCAGLDTMKGGMSRRYTCFQMLREKGWPVVALDVGNLVKGFGRQAELKFQIAVDAMRQMGYQGITLGPDDLQLPAAELMAAVAGVNGQPGPFVSANVGLFHLDPTILAPYRIVTAGGKRLAITGVIGREFQKQVHNNEIELADPEESLKKIVPEMKKKADYLILLANATLNESIALAGKFPQFDLVVTAGGPPEPPPHPTLLGGGKTRVVQVGEKGEHAIVLALYNGGQPAVRDQRVPLDSRFPPSTAMKQLMAAYQDQLKQMGLAGLGIRAVPHPLRQTNGRFVGSKACMDCHDVSYKVWKGSAHADAYATLANLDPPRNYDPECISCHVVGWHPTKFFPYQGGYESHKKTPHLENVGCEDCHGPGQGHVDAENGHDEKLQKKMQLAVRITEKEAADPNSGKQNCYSCHDGDNSPAFDFKTYWPLVEHHEKEE
jgi:hypothetical protein